MMDDKGRRVKEAGPSVPVEILGLNDVPNAGEVFVVARLLAFAFSSRTSEVSRIICCRCERRKDHVP